MHKLFEADPILRVPVVCQTIGLSRSKLYSMLSTGDFPQPIRIGGNSVGWRRSVVEGWLDSRPKVDLRKQLKPNVGTDADLAA